jgi:hypothetical protein
MDREFFGKSKTKKNAVDRAVEIHGVGKTTRFGSGFYIHTSKNTGRAIYIMNKDGAVRNGFEDILK